MADFGETLKQARAQKGVTLKEAEQATRINRNHLAALEDENFPALPPLIYQRGIVRNYAMYLGLDASRILSLFEDARGGDSTAAGGGVVAIPPVNMPAHWAPNFAIIAFAVVLSAIVFAWGYSAFVHPPEEEPASTEIVATVTPFPQKVTLPTEPPPTATPTPSPNPVANPTQVSGRVDTGRANATSEDGNGAASNGGDNQLNQQQAGDNQPVNESSGSGDNQQTAAAGDGQASTDDAQADDAAGAQNNGYIESIAVLAVEPITVSVVADGVSVFDGSLGAGEATAYFTGSVFDVYTTSGVNTTFINSCSDIPFQMGYEPGETKYVLEADAEYCGDPDG